jgi:hypothetical protein
MIDRVICRTTAPAVGRYDREQGGGVVRINHVTFFLLRDNLKLLASFPLARLAWDFRERDGPIILAKVSRYGFHVKQPLRSLKCSCLRRRRPVATENIGMHHQCAVKLQVNPILYNP